MEGAFCMSFVNGFVNGPLFTPLLRPPSPGCLAVHPPRDLEGRERPADDQLGERVGDLAVGFQVGRTYCFMVNATSACPIRLLRAFQSILAFQLVVSGLPAMLNGAIRSPAAGGIRQGW